MSGDIEKGLLALIAKSRESKKEKDEKLATALKNENVDALAEVIFKSDQVFRLILMIGFASFSSSQPY